MNAQWIVAGLLVAAAAAWLIRQLYRMVTAAAAGRASSCAGCSKSPAGPMGQVPGGSGLVEMPAAPRRRDHSPGQTAGRDRPDGSDNA